KAPLEVREQANYAEDANSRGAAALFVQQRLGENQENIWYLDSGASNHMCGQRDLFGDLDETIQGLVTFGDTLKVPFKGKGNISIKLKNGDHSYITDVCYVPAIKQNLVSIGQLMEKGYTLFTKNCHLTITDYNERLIAYVKMSKNRMFPLNIQSDTIKCLSAITNSEEWFWHLRLGHLNFTSLSMLVCKKMVKGIPHIDHPDEVCECCVLGKHHRSNFAKEINWKAKRPLKLVHTNVCGPIKPISTGQNRTVRSDQDGEYTANDFEAFYTQQGNKHQTTPAYTPQLNVYLLNRCPTRSLQIVTPEEAWSGHKPSVTHLQVFGCVAYVKIQDARKTKLDDKSEKCIFVGYGDRRMGYKLYNPIKKNTIMSRDVIFEEDKSWQWNDDQEAVKWISTDLILEDEVEVPTILVEGHEPQSPVHRFPVFNRRNTLESSSTPSSASSSEGPRRMRNLDELYDVTQVMEDTTLFCFFTDNDPLSFNKVIT
ncbi:hypothetical protein D5086_000608, partial [Populus alba]